MTKFDLDAADLNLIARCHRAKEAIPQIARAAQVMFWIMFTGVAFFTGVLIWMYVTKGPGGVPPGAQAYLVMGWLCTFGVFLASRSLQFEDQAVRLICKLTEE